MYPVMVGLRMLIEQWEGLKEVSIIFVFDDSKIIFLLRSTFLWCISFQYLDHVIRNVSMGKILQELLYVLSISTNTYEIFLINF